MSAHSPDTPPRLIDSLDLVLPALPCELVSSEAVHRLRSLARSLSPPHRAGFECRLAANDGRVDFQQGIASAGGEPRGLARFLAAGPSGAHSRRLRTLAERWATPGDPLHDGVAELWFEHDVADSFHVPPPDPAPSVFAKFTDSQAALPIAGAFLEAAVGRTGAEELEGPLRRSAGACRAPARMTHVGVMLGRPVASMRVHLSYVPLQLLGGHLTAAGWEGDVAEPQRLAGMLLDHADQLVVCLDIVSEQTVQIGLECFFGQKRGIDPRREPLLDRLVREGLCTAEKTRALLRWPGTITPMTGDPVWPGDLIAQSLLEPDDRLGLIERRLSHVKLILRPGAAVEAKAYFGFGHVWSSARPAPARRRQLPPVRSASAAREAITAATDKLLGARNQAGWWRDFFDRGRPADVTARVVGYASDEWVTAFAANALASVLTPAATDAARHALGLLLARRSDDCSGWGYHALLPADADTTAWVLRLGAALGEPSALRPAEAGVQTDRLAVAQRFLESLTDADGAVRTYPPSAAPELARFLRMEGSYVGWCGRHTCVTAAVAFLPQAAAARSHLRTAQRPDGSWTGHWWHDDEYATTRAVEALARSSEDGQRVAAGIAWSASRIDGDGAVRSAAHGGPSPFATGLALHAVRAGQGSTEGAHLAAAARAERWLLEHQLADGTWEPSARLRVPSSAATDPLESPRLTLTYVDDDGLFTTATVLAALTLGDPTHA